MHHYPDESLKTFLDENKFDVVIFSLIAGYYQYDKMKLFQKQLIIQKIDRFMLWEVTAQHQNQNFF